MPPKTRARAQASTITPRVYRSSPALHQRTFPSRDRVVKNTYGKTNPTSARARSLRQQTLTQIYDVNQHLDDVDASTLLPHDPETETTGQDAGEDKENPRKKGRGRPGKRRKTMGDTPNSSFHTQTLTQMPSFISSDKGEMDNLILQDHGELEKVEVKDSDEEDDDLDLLEVLSNVEPTVDPTPVKRGRKNCRSQTKTRAKKVVGNQQDNTHSLREDATVEIENTDKGKGKENLQAKDKDKEVSVTLDTPVLQRIWRHGYEVPSSQSPASPAVIPSPGAVSSPALLRFNGTINPDCSPTTQQSTKTDVPKTIRPPDMVIQDSYSTAPSSSARSDVENNTPVTTRRKLWPKGSSSSGKRKREPLADMSLREVTARDKDGPIDAEASQILGTMSADDVEENGAETPTKRTREGFEGREIPDSDDDFDFSPQKVEQTPARADSMKKCAEATPTRVPNGSGIVSDGPWDTSQATLSQSLGEKSAIASSSGARQVRSSVERVVDMPTQGARLFSVLEDESGVEEIQQGIPKKTPAETVLGDDFGDEVPSPGTPTPKARDVRFNLPPESHEKHQRNSAIKWGSPAAHRTSSPRFPRQTQARFQLYSQGLESQRVPLEIIKAMGPQSDRSDLVIPMDQQTVFEISTGIRDHEFRAKPLPMGTQRIWIYAMAPASELRFMATVGEAKRPGQIDNVIGLGNEEFNVGNSEHKVAHELLQVYELNNPQSWDKIKRENWLKLKTPPKPSQRSIWLPPVIVGRLLNNLRCALFGEPGEYINHEDEDEDHPADDTQGTDPTDSQQIIAVENQLHSEISQYSQGLASKDGEDVVLASQGSIDRKLTMFSASKSNSADMFVRPTAPARLTRSSQRRQAQQSQNRTQSISRSQSQSFPKLLKTPSTGRRRMANYGAGMRPSQATTASGPSSPAALDATAPVILTLSSSVERPPTLPRLLPEPSVPSMPDFVVDTREEDEESSATRPAPHLSSLLVSSQAAAALPESLFAENVRQPPPLIPDSDDEDV